METFRHEGGMPWFHQTLQVADLVPTRLKENHVGKVIQEEGQVKTINLQSGYFMLNHFNIINRFGEICNVFRCFPQKSTKPLESTMVSLEATFSTRYFVGWNQVGGLWGNI